MNFIITDKSTKETLLTSDFESHQNSSKLHQIFQEK